MSSSFVPQDNDVRKRIQESLDETLFVEAGAGTGKTTSLVDRVMQLAASGRTTLDRVAVITFTDAAAAELRDRIRGSLEKAASDGTLDDERLRCQRALADLDRSSIQTLHSFAGSILRERPLEAGLPPLFETMDAIQSDLAFDEAWREWVDLKLDEPEDESDLYPALALGLSIDQLRSVALEFHRNYDLLEGASFADTPRPSSSAVQQLMDESPELERLCQYSQLSDSDQLYSHVQQLLRNINRFLELGDDSPTVYRQLQRALPISRPRAGNQRNWDHDPVTSENACKALKELLGDLHETATEELAQAHQAALVPVLRALKDFVEDFARKRKSDGTAGFHDLLVWARDLLRDNLEVRDHFRQRFSHVLVDEAQDTDPIQAEIAMFIAEGVVEGGNDPLPVFPAKAGNPLEKGPPAVNRPTSWDQVIPQRGKLFVVGDPKQSIYRFRRADVRQMSKLRQVMGGDTVQLVQNFRSQRPVLEWVNYVYEQWMGEGSGHQAKYAPVAHRWEAATAHSGRPGVYRLGEALDENVNAVRNEEARDIAALLHIVVGDRWQVLDTTQTAEAGEERYADATYSDICVLMPRRTGLRTLEQALDDANVPYRLEGASLIFATQEVMDLLNCLKAIDDPADQVATVAALRSPAFACTDAELLQFSDAEGTFDYLSEDCLIDGPVAEALDLLRDFHRDRLWLSLPELIDGFIRARMLMESAIDHPRTREQWRRYRFIVEQARSFVETGGNSLRAFLEWIERQAAEGARVTETPVPEGDEEAVRIMTVHAAKGLEFPVVVLTALNTQSSTRRESVLFDRDTRVVEISIGPEGRRFETPGYETLATWERELGDDEQVRLLYVASTRARDHLVLSLYRSSKGRTSDAHKIAEILDGADNLWEPLPPFAGAAPQLQGASSKGFSLDGHSLANREEWNKRREEMLRLQLRPVSVSATKLAQVLKEEPDTDEPWRRGRAGTSVGRAVHSVLQTIDLSTGDGMEETSQAQAAAEGIPQRWAEVARLARVAVDSDIVRRAVAASRFWREVPVAAPMSNGVLQGFIDLLFEEDGNLVVVDYKTDAVDSDHVEDAAARYGPQGGAYALAVQKATGRPVTEVVFLFLHANHSAVLPEVPGLAVQAASNAEEYLNNNPVR